MFKKALVELKSKWWEAFNLGSNKLFYIVNDTRRVKSTQNNQSTSDLGSSQAGASRPGTGKQKTKDQEKEKYNNDPKDMIPIVYPTSM